MSKMKVTAAQKERYSAYRFERRYAKNKARKLERHLKQFPSDGQAQAALKDIVTYSRKKPYSKVPAIKFVVKKTLKGKSFTNKEKTNVPKIKASSYVNGIPFIDFDEKTVYQLALAKA